MCRNDGLLSEPIEDEREIERDARFARKGEEKAAERGAGVKANVPLGSERCSGYESGRGS